MLALGKKASRNSVESHKVAPLPASILYDLLQDDIMGTPIGHGG
jgi:hypothetical protein